MHQLGLFPLKPLEDLVVETLAGVSRVVLDHPRKPIPIRFANQDVGGLLLQNRVENMEDAIILFWQVGEDEMLDLGFLSMSTTMLYCCFHFVSEIILL